MNGKRKCVYRQETLIKITGSTGAIWMIQKTAADKKAVVFFAYKIVPQEKFVNILIGKSENNMLLEGR